MCEERQEQFSDGVGYNWIDSIKVLHLLCFFIYLLKRFGLLRPCQAHFKKLLVTGDHDDLALVVELEAFVIFKELF